MLFAGWFYYHKAALKLVWFQDVESMLNHHLAGLLGLGSLSWVGHQVHVSLPINQFLNAGVDPKEIPLSYEFILNRDLLAQLYPSFAKGATPFFTLNWSKYAEFLTFHGGLDPVTGGLWLTDIAHHHLAIAILFLIAGQGHKGPYEILTTSWHAQLSLNLAMLGSLTIVVAHHMYSMPHYPYLATDYGLHSFGLYIHNDTISTLRRLQDMFSDTAIQLQPVFVQWIQNTHTLAPGVMAPGATAMSAQQSAFTVGVLSDLYAFHRSTENSLCPYRTPACLSSLRDLTQHLTARADDSHAPPVSAFLKAPLSFKRIRGMSSPGRILNALAIALHGLIRTASSIHRLRLGLLGYLIPFTPLAFVS
ncbi:hypothetical protein PVK06_020693 [Gossypium arboreum]|uniref:Photosystem I P700 chlorophyll a apoprotein A1 n=1 Tax=Gossypium arboreum TaxID=29729 RepID=A0ABR0PNR4_GOSAR|nr:hypothetical protein PVK06_020693 [Gossypium arboreum]